MFGQRLCAGVGLGKGVLEALGGQGSGRGLGLQWGLQTGQRCSSEVQLGVALGTPLHSLYWFNPFTAPPTPCGRSHLSPGLQSRQRPQGAPPGPGSHSEPVPGGVCLRALPLVEGSPQAGRVLLAQQAECDRAEQGLGG